MNNRYLVGVDIGGTTIKIAIITHDGEVFTKWEIPTNKEELGKDIPTDIWESIKKKIDEYNISTKRIDGIGVGALVL